VALSARRPGAHSRPAASRRGRALPTGGSTMHEEKVELFRALEVVEVQERTQHTTQDLFSDYQYNYSCDY
jgi:hypothetical protein